MMLLFRIFVMLVVSVRFFFFKFANCCDLFSHSTSADRSLARPGRKQATATEDFDVHISYL
jgi:hypothetical protein